MSEATGGPGDGATRQGSRQAGLLAKAAVLAALLGVAMAAPRDRPDDREPEPAPQWRMVERSWRDLPEGGEGGEAGTGGTEFVRTGHRRWTDLDIAVRER